MKTILKIIGIILFISFFACQNNDSKNLFKEIENLTTQLETVNKELDSIKSTSAFLYSEALGNERDDLLKSIKIYQQIIKRDSISQWQELSRKRLYEYQELQDSTKKYVKNLFRLSDTLKLTHLNDKCGEWGGDFEEIIIVLKHNHDKGMYEGDLYGQYIKHEMDCSDLDADDKITIKTEYKKLSIREERLIKICIEDLLCHKLNNTNLIYHAGISNRVILKDPIAFVNDPALLISDYPSIYWKSFHDLKKKIISK